MYFLVSHLLDNGGGENRSSDVTRHGKTVFLIKPVYTDMLYLFTVAVFSALGNVLVQVDPVKSQKNWHSGVL